MLGVESDTPDTGAIPKELQLFRQDIDALDKELVMLLARRFEVIRHVAAWKAEHGVAAILPERINEVIARTEAIARTLNLPQGLVARLYEIIVAQACALEDSLIALRDLRGRGERP
jgi:isochorismate pyruvate lyase